MKRISILTLMLAFIALNTFAINPIVPQQKATSSVEKRAQESTDQLKTKVQLTTDQYQKVLKINKTFYAQTDSIKGSGKAITEDVKVRIKVLAQVSEDEINSVLTAEQRNKLAGK